MALQRGEVWLFDCGMMEKVRPVLIFSIPFADTDRAIVTVIFHSTALRGSQFEVSVHSVPATGRLYCSKRCHLSNNQSHSKVGSTQRERFLKG